LVVVSFLPAFLLLALQNPATIPVPRAGDWMLRHEAMAEIAKRGDSDLIFIGDSITHAFGGEPRTGESFLDRGKDTWDLYFGSDKPLNLGISGDRTQHVLWRLDNGGLGTCKPKVAVVMIGTNNAGSNTPEQIAEGVQAVCGRVRALSPVTKILLLGIFPRDKADSKLRATVDAVNGRLASWARGGPVTYLDIGKAFLDGKGEIPSDVMPDLLHPMGFGYRKWAIAMEPTLARLMGRKPKTTLNPRNSAVVPVPQDRNRPRQDWMARHEAVLKHGRENRCRLAFVGASIIQFMGGPPTDRVSPAWHAYYANRDAVDLGFSGDRTENVLWRLEQGEVDGLNLQAAVFMTGGNNTGSNTPEEIRDGVRAILTLFRSKQPRCSVLLHAIFPRGEKPDHIERIRAKRANVLLQRLAAEMGVDYMDAGHVFLEKDGTISTETMPDFLHPTPRAYLRWQGEIEPWIKAHVNAIGG
jgi:lysophospholipase L1-like esterase